MFEKLSLWLAGKIGAGAAAWVFTLIPFLCGMYLGGWLNGLRLEVRFDAERLEWAGQQRAAAEAHAAELSTALAETRRYQTAANQAEAKNAEIQNQIRAASAATDAADRRLREQLSAARAALAARLNTEASAAMATAALDVAGRCAEEYRGVGHALARCDAEVTRVFGYFPKEQKNE
jgi:hypothetical protein